MATFRARRSITSGLVPVLLLAALLLLFFGATYLYERFHAAPHTRFLAPSRAQIRAKTDRDARYLRLYTEKTRLEAQIQAARPNLEARKNALQAEEATLLDTQAHLTIERRDIAYASPPAQAIFNAEVRAFNRRRNALMASDAALARDVDSLNHAIRRRNQSVQALDAMNKSR